MPDMNRTSNLISLMREDAVFVHWWILYQHPYPEIIKKLRRDLAHEMAAGTTIATTFKIRLGPAGANTAYVNGGTGGSREFGGISAARLRVTEIKV